MVAVENSPIEPDDIDDDISTYAPPDSRFLRGCQMVSTYMSRPVNIITWLVAVVVWTAIFAFGGPNLASGNWLPKWFTSQGYNFPLNLITTVAELFIGFLVGTATAHAQDALSALLRHIQALLGQVKNLLVHVQEVLTQLQEALTKIAELDEKVEQLLEENTAITRRAEQGITENNTLTKQVQALTAEVHACVRPTPPTSTRTRKKTS